MEPYEATSEVSESENIKQIPSAQNTKTVAVINELQKSPAAHLQPNVNTN